MAWRAKIVPRGLVQFLNRQGKQEKGCAHKTKEKRKFLKYEGEWHLGAYNLFNRAQPTRVEVVATDAGYKYQAKGLFGFIPFVAYNFKF